MTAATIEREIIAGITRRASAAGEGAKADFFDTAVDLFVVADRDGTVLLANDAWTRVLGWSRGQLSAAPLLELVHPDDVRVTNALWPVMARGELAGTENRYRCADGGYRWLLWSAFQRDGRVYGAAKDITDRKTAELAVVEDERRAHALIDALPDGVTLIDATGRITDVNRRFCEMVGLDAASVVGAVAPYPWWPQQDREELGSLLASGMGRGRLRARATFRRASGERFPTTIDVAGHPLADGTPGMLCVMRDDSERVQERRLLGDIEKLALVANWTWDPATDVVSTSTPFQTYSRMGVDAPSHGRMEDLLALVAETHVRAVRDALEATARTGQTTSLEYPARAMTGEQRWYATTLQPQTAEPGGPVSAVLGISQDITRRQVADARAAEVEAFWHATLDSLDDHVAVLDATGTIVAVNAAWTRYATSHGAREADVGVGIDYLAACERAAAVVPEAVRLARRLSALLAGRTDRVDHEYACDDPRGRRWFTMTATRFVGASDTFAVVQHADVTERKLTELAARADRDRLLEAQRVAGLGAWELDVRANTIEVSEQYPALLGGAGAGVVPVEAFLARVWEADRERVAGLAAAAEATAGYVDIEWRFGPSDDPRWAATRAFAVRDLDGTVTHVRGVTQDITFRRRTEQQLRLQARLLDSVDASVLATDADGVVTYANAGFEELYGLSAKDVVGTTAGDLSEALGSSATPDTSAQESAARELYLQRPTGEDVAVYLRRKPLHTEAGTFEGSLYLTVDINARVEAERKLRSAHDFLDAVTDTMDDGVMTLDPHGRVRYTNVAAERMLGWTREDLLDRPIAAVVGTELPAGAAILRVDDASFTRSDGTRLPVSFTASPFDVESGERGSVVVFRDITARKAEQERLLQRVTDMTCVNRIRDALQHDRFVLYGQPIIDVATGETVQHELLIRMVEEDGTIVAPCEFLPVAERTGLIGQIDRWVIREALVLAAGGRAVELNLSAHSVCDPDTLGFFETALRDSGVDPGLLVVELTETALLDRPEAAERFVRRVQELGCRFALDDFGTGYGGFTYLKRLPVSYLKIDIDFVRNLPRDPAGRTVVEAVVNLARGFGQKTVAEGVEDDETLELLRELGVDYAQGYGIARPAPIA